MSIFQVDESPGAATYQFDGPEGPPAPRFQIATRIGPNQIARAGDGTGAAGSATPGGKSPAKPERIRLDILGADEPTDSFLAKEASKHQEKKLRVTSLDDMINQVEKEAPAGAGRCVENLMVFNHGKPGLQEVYGEGGKKVKGASKTRSGFTIDWLYDPADQAALGRLRGSFCCAASMDWLGCSVAGVEAFGGTARTDGEKAAAGEIGSEEKADVKERYDEYGFRYQNEEEAIKHGASLQGASFGREMVQAWADATCTTIKAATDFIHHYADKGTYRVMFKGEILTFAPGKGGECTCNAETGRVQGKWAPNAGKAGNAQWDTDIKGFNAAVDPRVTENLKVISSWIAALLADVASMLQIPAGLPLGPMVQPWIDAKKVSQVDAFTYDYLALSIPADAWKWIGVWRSIIQETADNTATVLSHELQHAADLNRAATEFRKSHGPPPTPPAVAMKPGYKLDSGDPFDKYASDFREFYRGGLGQMRHLDIYADSAQKGFESFSSREKVAWFMSMLKSVPPDVPAATALPTEPLVASVYANANVGDSATRRRFLTSLNDVTRGFASRKPSLGRARTLVNHFKPVWDVDPVMRSLANQAIAIEAQEPDRPGDKNWDEGQLM